MPKKLEPLLEKAKELEKKYEWLQAAELYKKASKILFEEKDFVNAAELAERLGYCYFKAADQAGTNKEFRKHMKQAVQAYRKESELLEKTIVETKQVEIDHVTALIALVEAVLERNLLKKRKLLDKWWTLENQVINAHEKSGDLSSAGKVCNEILEYSRRHRFWFALNYSEYEKNSEEYRKLVEKAIQTFSKLNDEYELARAYFLATFYHSFTGFEKPEDREQFTQKAREYSKKALELSHKTGDPWLIGESYRSKFWDRQALKDSTLAIEDYRKAIKYGKIAKSNYLIIGGNVLAANLLSTQALVLEDPDKQKENLKKAIKLFQKIKHLAEITENVVYFWVAYRDYTNAVNNLASIETDPKIKQELLELATELNQEGMQKLQGLKMLSVFFLWFMSDTLQLISKTKNEIEEKRKLLQKSKCYMKDFLVIHKEMFPFQYGFAARGYYQLAQVQNEVATIETDGNSKIEILKRAVCSVEKSIELRKKVLIHFSNKILLNSHGMSYDFLGSLLVQINVISKQENTLLNAIDSYQKASLYFEKAEMPTQIAESHWHLAQLHDRLDEYQKASENYELAAKAFDLSSKKISQLSEFYSNYANYMRAWSQIEQARYHHSIEDYQKSQQHYEKAARLHESTDFWSYLTPNYLAWANMEEAESLSRNEKTQQANQAFQKAVEQFSNAEKSIKQKMDKITSADEKEMTQKLLMASEHRRKYCQARILLEEAKLLDRQGKYLQSSKNYGEAAQKITAIVDKIDIETDRKELEYISILCQAWEKMATAEETTSSGSYMEAAALFEKANDFCFTKQTSLWALGNSSFCKGLAAGTRYQGSMDLKENAMAKRHMKRAASSYLQAGFKNASEHAKAMQRLFDAYVFMNQAESEVDPDKKAKQYQMAENLLQISAGSFMKAKQPEKTAQVQQVLKTVREEKALAVSLNDVMHAPTITSSTSSFTAPAPTNEASVGLESFEHANVQANLIASVREVKVGQSFCLSVEFVNAGKEPALLTRVEDFIPSDFVVVKKPEIYRIEETCLNMKGKQLAPLKLVEVKLTLQPSKKGEYKLKPRVHYLDELGQNRSLELKSVEIKVEEVVLGDRVSTGTEELDSLLLGGIPEEYAVVLAGPPCDERDMMVKNFLKAGTKDEETTFYISKEVVGLEDLLDNRNFILFLCNPKPKAQVPDFPNVYKLRGTTDLTNLGIALAKAYRGIGKSVAKRRVCVEILSDVLVEYGTKTAREWMSGLITDLGSKGFTLLAVMDPKEHPTDQATTVLNLFDGEIEVTQTEDPLECKKSIRVKKLRSQDYIKNPICLT
ncbi:MAG: ATPase domain-containing protein [Candidatus Bathyarchaeota archaeon]